MSDLYAKERAARLEVARAQGAARLALWGALPAALTAATGEEWTAGAARWTSPGDNDSFETVGAAADDPARFQSGTVTRTRDGFAVRFGEDWRNNRKDRCQASIQWPEPKGKTHGGNRYRGLKDSVALGENGRRPFSYDTPEPVATFDPSRPVKAIAGQIVRALILPEYAAAWAGFLDQDAATLARENTAAEWLQAVGEAAGAIAETSQNDPGRVWWRNADPRAGRTGGPDWGRIADANPFRAGGELVIRIPDDPRAAAAMVAAVRSILEPKPAGPYVGQDAGALDDLADDHGAENLKAFSVIVTRDVTESQVLDVIAPDADTARDLARDYADGNPDGWTVDDGNAWNSGYVTGCDELSEGEAADLVARVKGGAA